MSSIREVICFEGCFTSLVASLAVARCPRSYQGTEAIGTPCDGNTWVADRFLDGASVAGSEVELLMVNDAWLHD